LGKHETSDVPAVPRTTHTVVTSSIKKPLGAKKTGKTGGLGARKLTSKPSESLYDQKPEEPPVQVSTSTNSASTVGPSLTSRFEYTDNVQATDVGSGGTHLINHISPPKSSSFFADYGMESGFPKKTNSNSSKLQETDEARKKFSNAKSISSAQYFGNQNNGGNVDSQVSLQKFSGSAAISSADLFGDDADSSLDLAASDLINRLSFQAQQDISSLKNMAGETGKKLSSLASSFMSDFQDRVL